MRFSIFEAGMLVCFGFAWPFSIWKSWRSRQNGGKSVWFLAIIWLGYVCGLLHKLIYHPDPVIVLYSLNGTMVAMDIGLYIRNWRLARRNSGNG